VYFQTKSFLYSFEVVNLRGKKRFRKRSGFMFKIKVLRTSCKIDQNFTNVGIVSRFCILLFGNCYI